MKTSIHQKLRLRFGTAALVALNLLPCPALGQTTDTLGVLVHGLNSNGLVWSQFLADIGATFREPLLSPSFAQNSYITQSTDLQALIGSSPVRGLVGHSNGGVVAREFAQRASAGLSVTTVGSPNAGTPFADNLGPLAAGFGSILGNLSAVLLELGFLPFGYSPDLDWAIGTSFTAGLFLYSFDFVMLDVACLAGFCGHEPLIGSMGVGGYAASVLNAGPNLAIEQNLTTSAIGIRTTFDENNNAAYVWLKVLFPDNWETWATSWETTRLLYFAVATSLLNLDPPLPEAALVGSLIIYTLPLFDAPDYVWCDALGAPAWNTGNFWACTQTDGLVPLWSQTHPLMTGDQAFYDVFGVPHTQQTRNLLVEAKILSAMEAGGFTRQP